ncbi:tensin-2 isoform X2 [Ranitomeya variabilis]|uniref:tensin-2 isoform X2 n=1 Tax=Ranitomeya variabilis TaxID=490064 RepID=UPI0040564E01
MKPRRSFQEVLRGLSRSFNCATPTGGERHIFHEKVLKKKRLCAACSEPVVSQGSVCRVCKITSHKKCEGKVPPGCSSPPPADMRRRTAPGPCIQHMGSTKSLNVKQRSSLPRSFSLDQVIQRNYDLDLTYITERIISVFFPTILEEQRYRSNLREVASMLRSKHEDKYLFFNLSRKRHDIKKLNPKVQEFFWPDCHAPSLDVICSICKAMEAWLNNDPQHVVVLHCKGNQGKTGVVIASYMHYSKVSASVDQALSTLAMRKFCEDKVSSSLHPSQRRYINYFGGLLSGNIKISSGMLSLQCVLLPVIPALQNDGGFCPFLKIYQSMQLVYTSGIYLSHGDGDNKKRQLCVSLEPALLLKGDIMVKCYHKLCKPHEREVLFRLQFHTCTIHNTHLCFSKDQLDCASTDDRFPDDAAVEFIFSSGQDKVNGREVFRKDPSVSVDYDITDPLVRYDSYENLNVNHEDSLEDLSHTRGPLDGSLYARVKKKSTPLTSTNGSPEQHGRLLSVSSDSGHSSAPTERLEESPQKTLPTAAEREDLAKLLGGFGVNVKNEREPHYSQLVKCEDVVTQNGHQRQNIEERPRNLHHQMHQEGINQNNQAKVNGDSRFQYSPQWSGVSDEGPSQNLPLTPPSWDEQRESPCEAIILEDEVAQFGSLAVYPGRRAVLSRHCSCRVGYAGPNIEGPPSRSYFRPEGILDPRGAPGAGAILQGCHYPGMYGDQERRRVYRSLSEGPQHYPSQTQSPPKRGSLRENRQYMCQPISHEPVLPPMCPCSHCQNSACYPVPGLWTMEGGKMSTMQPFHRGEFPLHLSQPYGQSVQPNHDISPAYQVPPVKMQYGFTVPHGEDSLHFSNFADTGYGHAYPHLLHPSYLQAHCPPNGYVPHPFPGCMSSCNQTGGQSPPSSVSPIVPSSCTPQRMSGDTMSAGSPGELTPPQQHQQDVLDHVVPRDAPFFQQPNPRGATTAANVSSIAQSNHAVHVQSPLLTSSPTSSQSSGPNTNPHAHSPLHGRSTVPPDAFVYPQSPLHVSTPINTHCLPAQAQHNLIHTQNTAVQTHIPPMSPSHRPLIHADHGTQPKNSSGQQNTVQRQSSVVQKQSPPRAHVHFHSQVTVGPVQSQNPVAQTNGYGPKNSPVQSHGLEQVRNTSVQLPDTVTLEQTVPAHKIVHTQGFSSPVRSQSEGTAPSNGQVQGPGQTVPVHKILHTQGYSSPVCSQSEGTAPSNGQTQGPGQTVAAHKIVHTQGFSSPVRSQSEGTAPSNGQVQGQGQTISAHKIVHTQGFSSPVRSQSEGTAPSNDQVQGPGPLSPLTSQSSGTQAQPAVHTQFSQSHPPVHRQSSAGQATTVVRTQGGFTQENKPKPTSFHQPGPVCTSTTCTPTNSTVQTQHVHSDNTMPVHSTVHTQMPSLTLHSPVQRQGPQLHSTVHIQNTLQTFRTPCNQSQSAPNYQLAQTQSQSYPVSPGSTGRVEVTDPNVNLASPIPEGNDSHSASPPRVSKVVPQIPINPSPRTIEEAKGPIPLGSAPVPTETSPQAGQYSVATEATSPPQQPPMLNPVTPQKRTITMSLPEAPVTCHGAEVTTSPPLSPMGSQCDQLSPSPTPLFPISTAYYSGSPCPPHAQPPTLPEKCHIPSSVEKLGTLGRPNEQQAEKSPSSIKDIQLDIPPAANFVQDSSRFWYKPSISREQAIALLRSAEPGSFLIRDSNSFRGAYGLALKVSSPPPNAVTQPCKDPSEQLVRHFLIETGPKGVKIKGSPIEPHFGSLSALVSQHSVTPLSLPCRLRVPDKDLAEQSADVVVHTNMSTAADLLRQGAACSVLYLGSVDTESLTGPQAISRASSAILTPPRSTATIVHFKVSDQGITLTDSQRKLFFRRHYPISSVTYCSADPQDRRWTNPDRTTSKVFGFVARKAGSTAENVCHLFAEVDPEQPASAIVNFITKVMLGTHRR